MQSNPIEVFLRRLFSDQNKDFLLDDPRKYRRYFAWSFVGSVLLLVYASMLPIKYQAYSFEQAFEAFIHLPWLDIQIYGRADWVANLLVVVPLGWLGAAAIDWGRKSRHFLLLLMPALVIFLCVLVIGIEFLQAWFPIRTQSLNDIAAGCLGALSGPLVWLVTGRWTMQTLFNLLGGGLSRQQLWHGALLYAAASLAFTVLPLDLVISATELKEKALLGRLEIFPAFQSPVESLKPVALTVIRVAPLTILLYLARGIRKAILFSIGFSVLCELLQVPVFSRHASLFHAFVSSCTTVCVALLCQIRWSAFPILKRSGFWLALSIASSLGLLVAVAMTAERVVRDPQELADRCRESFHWPLAGYYYQAEFSALTTLVYKSIIFAWIGGCCGITVLMASDNVKKMIRLSAAIVMLFTAVTAEFSQVYLPPHIPAAFDAVLYLAIMLGVARFTSECGQNKKLMA